jgi:hypothetical protein
MRYVGILLVLSAALAAAIVIPRYAQHAPGALNVMPSNTRLPEPTPPWDPVEVREQAEQTLPASPEMEPGSREQAIGAARSLVRTLGTDLRLIDARRMTRGEAISFLDLEARNYTGPNEPPADRPVFVVRFQGLFTRDAGRFPPKPGTGWVVIDAITGKEDFYGYERTVTS